MKKKFVSARGVYYDLEKSPYIYTDNLGNIFKFSSEKKLDMFIKKIKDKEDLWIKEIKRLETLGYIVTKDYFVNINRLPELIYRDMIYK